MSVQRVLARLVDFTGRHVKDIEVLPNTPTILMPVLTPLNVDYSGEAAPSKMPDFPVRRFNRRGWTLIDRVVWRRGHCPPDHEFCGDLLPFYEPEVAALYREVR